MRRATLTEYAIRWAESIPGLPDESAPSTNVEEVRAALDASAFKGRIIKRTVTYTEWEDAEA